MSSPSQLSYHHVPFSGLAAVCSVLVLAPSQSELYGGAPEEAILLSRNGARLDSILYEVTLSLCILSKKSVSSELLAMNF